MRDEYDFSKAAKNPYADKTTKIVITIRLDRDTVAYFKALSVKLNMPCQTLINAFLSDCAARKLTPKITWS